ncbi:MAG: molybdopterin molybdotransferase MoeA [Candidatus Thorarchaeota archaeon]|jgi:molybdenum cofactor synthesis domain-containing protein
MKKMEPFKLLVSHDKAKEAIMRTCIPIERVEKIPIEEASERVLASDVKADRSVPPFDRSAMDGYAVIAEDTFGADESENYLKLDGVIHAGVVSDQVVKQGHCIQIATGSPLPSGANSVVMVEYTERHNDRILVTRPLYPGANVSKKGEDIEKGDIVLTEGAWLTPAKIGTLAALGRTEVEVYARPRIAVIPTGEEIVEPGENLNPGQIYDVNSFTLEALLEQNGAQANRFGIVGDDYSALKDTIEKALEYDMVIFSGGSSVGEKDLLAGILADVGEILFHGVQIKPGKPTLYGIAKNKPVFGMPGYPTSCLSNAYIFLIPAVRQMARIPPAHQNTLHAKISKRLVSSSGRQQFLTVRIRDGIAYPVYKHSGAITSMATADGYIILPVNLDVIEEGEMVEVTLFE